MDSDAISLRELDRNGDGLCEWRVRQIAEICGAGEFEIWCRTKTFTSMFHYVVCCSTSTLTASIIFRFIFVFSVSEDGFLYARMKYILNYVKYCWVCQILTLMSLPLSSFFVLFFLLSIHSAVFMLVWLFSRQLRRIITRKPAFQQLLLLLLFSFH